MRAKQLIAVICTHGSMTYSDPLYALDLVGLVFQGQPPQGQLACFWKVDSDIFSGKLKCPPNVFVYRLLLLLVTVLTESFLPFVRCDLMTLTLLSTRHILLSFN